MTRHLTVRKTVTNTVIMLFSLTALLFGVENAFAALSCNGCHANPPTDGARLSSTGSSTFAGNHTKHVFGATNSATAINVCSTCHGTAATSYTSAHSAYTSASMNAPYINMASKIGTYSSAHGRARYNKGTFNASKNIVFFNQTSIPTMTTCSNVDCHFERKTPAWGSTLFASPTDCNKCHGLPPSGVSSGNPMMDYTGGAAGSHLEHNVYYTGTAGCVKCHVDRTADTNKFTHATSGRTGHSLVVSVKDPLDVASGTYSRTATYPSYYPSAVGTVTYGTCSTNYCHSQGNSAHVAPVTTPTWGDNTLTCASCHKGAGPGGMDSGAGTSYGHTKHVQTYTISCKKCHDATVSNDSTVKSYALHVNKTADIKFYQNRSTASSSATYGGNAAYSATYNKPLKTSAAVGAACLGTYCHSTGRSATDFTSAAFKPLSTPVWGQALPPAGAAYCHSCHGGDSTNTFKMISSGGHKRHIGGTANYSIGCAVCHSQTVTNNTTINPAKIKLHTDFAVNVDMATGTYNGANIKLAGSAYASCTATTCHSDGKGGSVSQAWGKNLITNCTTCHGMGTGTLTGPATDLSVPHASHVNNLSGLGANYTCNDCHAYTVNSSNSVIDKALHTNELINYSGARSGKMTAFAYTVDKTCSTTYCHTSGKKGVTGLPAGAEPSAPAWNSTAMTCGSCHGAGTGNGTFVTTGRVGTPNYSSARTGGSAAANSHKKHVATQADCVACHVKTTTDGTTLVTGSLHTDKAINVNMTRMPYSGTKYSNFSGAYNSSNKTCTNTYCHGTAATVGWGSPSLACNQCHSAAPGLNTQPDRFWFAYSSAHRQHVEVSTLPTTFSVAPANNSSATQYNFSCTSCHSDTMGATHAGGMKSATQAAEVFFGFTTLGKKGPYAPGTAKGSTDNGFKWTAGTCSNIYCHSDGNGGTPKMLSSTWNWGSKQNAIRCQGCHGSQDIKNGTLQGQSGYSSIRTNAHARHVRADINTELGYANGLECYRCHAATVYAPLNSANVALGGYSTVASTNFNKGHHVNKMREYSGAKVNPNTSVATAGGSSGQFNSTTKTCSNVYCHSNSKVGTPLLGSYPPVASWTSGVTNQKCNYCHGTQSQIRIDSDADFSKYSSTGVPNYATAGLGTYSANSHRKHILSYGTTNYRDTQVCYNCHAATLASDTSAALAKFRPYSSRHTSGTYNIKMKPTLGASTYNTTNKTCSVNTCHGAGTPQWGGTVNCQDCHGNGATATASDYAANFWANDVVSKIKMTGTGSWAAGGHGASAAYSSGLPGANLTSCEYCHDPLSKHKDSTNAFRLKNYSTVEFGRNAPCLTCHSASGGGITVGGVNKKRTSSLAVEADHFGGSHSAAYNGGQFCWDCHNPHGNGTSNLFMIRTNPTKVSNRTTGEPTTTSTTAVIFTANATGTDYAKSVTPFTGVCNVCHTYDVAGGTGKTKYYGDIAALTAPAPHNADKACTDCHKHEGSTTTRNDAFKGAGGCDGCHAYQVGSWTSKTERASLTVFEGKGNNGTDNANSHNKHINYLLTRYAAQLPTGLNAQTDQFGSGNSWTYVCGVCHSSSSHNMSEAIPGTGRQIVISNTYQFGASAPVYNAAGNIGASSSTSSKTCSNVSCHYFKSPVWSTY